MPQGRDTCRLVLEERGHVHFGKQLAVQWLILGLALAALGCAVAFFLRSSWLDLRKAKGDTLLLQARVIEKNLARQLDVADDTLKMLAGRWAARDTKLDPEVRNRMLADLDHAAEGMRTFIILDTEGFVRNSSRSDLVGRNFRDRDYFKTVAADTDRKRLHILPPFKTIYGFYAMPAARAILSSTGEFIGVITVSLDPDFFTTLIGSVLSTPDMWGAVAHSGGSLFLLAPPRDEFIGKNLAVPGSFFTRHTASGEEETLLTGTVYTTGEKRMMAQRNVYPTKSPCGEHLVAALSCDLDAIHAGWRSTAAALGSVYAALALSSVAGLALYQRRQRQARMRLLERERELHKALSEVRTLSGLLPICSSCKKIRDDQGYWNILEKYISEHSGAEFTHGLCPDCLKNLYPEYSRKK